MGDFFFKINQNEYSGIMCLCVYCHLSIQEKNMPNNKVVLVTGGAKRIGAEICKRFHHEGWCVIIHYNQSIHEAFALADELNKLRPHSAAVVSGDLSVIKNCASIVTNSVAAFGRIDALVNNASSSPTDIDLGDTFDAWQALFRCNVFAPYQLSQMMKAELTARAGSVVNLLDVRATSMNPFSGWAIYTATKAALHSLTISAAKEFAPAVRVNAVSPGITLPFPDEDWTEDRAREMNARSLLHKVATPADIADSVFWLTQAGHVTGQVITIDGGEKFQW